MMFMRKAYVLGAGPTGLLAAHAAEARGWIVKVFTAGDSDPQKSELHGCQYLHTSIPGVTFSIDGRPVRYLLRGSVESYRRKVYGDAWSGDVSPDEYGPEQSHYAWNLRTAYDELWDQWKSRIQVLNVTPRLAAELTNEKRTIVFSTIPATALCLKTDEHRFTTQGIWAMGSVKPQPVVWHDRPFDPMAELPVTQEPPYLAPENTVECNGEDAPRWYRAATVFGHSTLEWPGGARPPISGVVAVNKPLSTDCDCHLNGRANWVRLGRYGKWQKGYLVHQAYEDVMAL